MVACRTMAVGSGHLPHPVVSAMVWKPINGGDGFWVQPDPNDIHTAYAESQGGNINRINLVNTKR